MTPPKTEKLFGLFLVLAVHGGLFYFLWQQRLLPLPEAFQPIMVELIHPASPPSVVPSAPSVRVQNPLPIPHPPKSLPTAQLLSHAPAHSATENVAPAPLVAPSNVVEHVVPTAPVLSMPLKLGGDLALICPYRPAPPYPVLSRRMGEEGRVMLRVELDEQGMVSHTQLHSSSGFSRLDEAALAAVTRWRCTPATRNGLVVKAVALQPFNFTLEAN